MMAGWRSVAGAARRARHAAIAGVLISLSIIKATVHRVRRCAMWPRPGLATRCPVAPRLLGAVRPRSSPPRARCFSSYTAAERWIRSSTSHPIAARAIHRRNPVAQPRPDDGRVPHRQHCRRGGRPSDPRLVLCWSVPSVGRSVALSPSAQGNFYPCHWHPLYPALDARRDRHCVHFSRAVNLTM